MLGLIATRSIDEPVIGLKDLMAHHQERIRSGITAVSLLDAIRDGDRSSSTMQAFEDAKSDLGYGLLLKRYTQNVNNLKQISKLQP